MLVLSRKEMDAILVGDNIRITVVSIRGNQVRLGIEAPSSIRIFREELCTPRADAAAPEAVAAHAPGLPIGEVAGC